MYLDVVIVLALVIFAICWFRRFSKFVYAWAIIDMFLRLIHFVAEDLFKMKDFSRWVNNIFPRSIPALMDKYSSGILFTIFLWIYGVIMAFFLGYTIRAFIRKKV